MKITVLVKRVESALADAKERVEFTIAGDGASTFSTPYANLCAKTMRGGCPKELGDGRVCGKHGDCVDEKFRCEDGHVSEYPADPNLITRILVALDNGSIESTEDEFREIAQLLAEETQASTENSP